MRVLLDTNVLARAAQVGHPQHEAAAKAVAAMPNRGLTTVLVPQNLYEFWVVCTRPLGENGLGMEVGAARVMIEELRKAFQVMDETPAFLPTWESLVAQHDVRGKSAHDARLVAAMKVHGITMLLTFNKQHFVRYAGVSIMTPDEAVGTQSGPRSVGRA